MPALPLTSDLDITHMTLTVSGANWADSSLLHVAPGKAINYQTKVNTGNRETSRETDNTGLRLVPSSSDHYMTMMTTIMQEMHDGYNIGSGTTCVVCTYLQGGGLTLSHFLII